MRLATVSKDEAIEVSPVWFVVRDEALYFAIDPTVGDPGGRQPPHGGICRRSTQADACPQSSTMARICRTSVAYS